VLTHIFDKRFQAPVQERVPYFEYPYDLKHEDGSYALDVISVQDNLVFETQGAIANRTVERLGDSDRGILMHRQLLRQQMAILEDGGEPMNVFRDPAKNRILPLPAVSRYYERGGASDGRYRKGAITASFIDSYAPFAAEIEDLRAAEAAAKGLTVE
jgi:5,5'-dehydrodivanillate O-demethylase